MKKIITITVVVNFFLIAAIFTHCYRSSAEKTEETEIINKIEPPKEPIPKKPEPPKEKRYEPEWTDCPEKRKVGEQHGKVYQDVMSHAAGSEIHGSGDICTQVHETCHGICKRTEDRYGFYCLENRMCYIDDVNTKLSAVAEKVPSSLRGRTYNLYLRQQQTYFESDPIYIFDEWIAYTNGSACAVDATKSGKYSSQRWDTVAFMREFDVYALTLAMVAKPTDEQFKNMLGWQLERTAKIYEEARQHPNLTYKWQNEYVEKWQTSPDAEELRKFTREYLGEEWTKRVLGF